MADPSFTLNDDQIYEIFEEIPSDGESIDGLDDDRWEEEERYLQQDGTQLPAYLEAQTDNELIDITNLPLFIEDEMGQHELPPTDPVAIGPPQDDPGSSTEPQDDDVIQFDDNDTPLCLRYHEEIGYIWGEKYTKNNSDFTFRKTSGPSHENLSSPIDYFMDIFPEDLINRIVFQTNLYCTQKLQGGSNFVPTTNNEVKVFLGINILMGIKRLPSYRDYWSADPAIRDPFISSAMTVNRFGWFLTNLHLNDNTNMPNRQDPAYDKLFKIRPFLDTLSRTFLESYQPKEFQSVDESMIRFKGRSTLKQYMPLKPVKRGYKVWVRADESGFICEFQIYTGRLRDGRAEKLLGERVVRDLTEKIVGENHKVYFDNFFSSMDLLKVLQSQKIQACCTVRKDRVNLPKFFNKDQIMRRGDSDVRCTLAGLVCVKWMYKKPVIFASNYHDPNEKSSVKRKLKNGTKVDVPSTTLVSDYNKHMGYVDKADQLKKCYQIDRRSRKWWHRIFFHFLDVCIVNSYIMFSQQSEGATLSLKQFQDQLITKLDVQ
ncbi:piggyBac transposable element-derived protein 4-like [Homalodisca vitripennis]|uniref:piggyBac transposable element-derived protein 4-like n=1 Tax=Homalodisca vitripennis TaxID=197043 RepID=UPI001EEC8858|nr:piggyBac transposable element-derived protein 4-like [Homalodisca vitripennis]